MLGVEDSYAAYCIDEAYMYILCRIEQEDRLPPVLEKAARPKNNARTVERLCTMKGVTHIDHRRNGGSVSAPDHR